MMIRLLRVIVTALLIAHVHTAVPSDAAASGTSPRASKTPRLTDQYGKVFKLDDLKGKPSVVNFGFTLCPVVCPTMLSGVSFYMNKLAKRADDINFVFVSVDPERDTAEVLKEYIGNFDDRIIGVTGTSEGIADLAKVFDTKYEKRAVDGASYEMAHVIFAYLLDKTGKKVGTLYTGSDANPRFVMERLTKLLQE